MNKCYLVVRQTGIYDDACENPVVVTLSPSRAQDIRERLTRLVSKPVLSFVQKHEDTSWEVKRHQWETLADEQKKLLTELQTHDPGLEFHDLTATIEYDIREVDFDTENGGLDRD